MPQTTTVTVEEAMEKIRAIVAAVPADDRAELAEELGLHAADLAITYPSA